MPTYRALRFAFELDVEGSPSVDIEAVFAGLADPTATPRIRLVVRFDESGATLLEDGEVLVRGSTAGVLQWVISRISRDLTGPEDDAAVHSSTVTRDGRGVMLVGPSTRGKSTMAARCMAGGFGLVAEDVSAVDAESLVVRPFHRPLGLARRSLELLDLAVPPGVAEDGADKLLISADNLGFATVGPTTVTVVAICDRSRTGVEELSPAVMLLRFLELGVAPYPDPGRHLGVFARVLAGARCLELGTADLDAAFDALVEALEHPPSPQPTNVVVEGDRVEILCGPEAVLLDLSDQQVHHLNESAAAVWAHHAAGAAPSAIASELGISVAEVDGAIDELRARGLLDV